MKVGEVQDSPKLLEVHGVNPTRATRNTATKEFAGTIHLSRSINLSSQFDSWLLR